jgi:hypothetical protein
MPESLFRFAFLVIENAPLRAQYHVAAWRNARREKQALSDKEQAADCIKALSEG